MGRAEFGSKEPAVTLIGDAVLVADIFEPADRSTAILFVRKAVN